MHEDVMAKTLLWNARLENSWKTIKKKRLRLSNHLVYLTEGGETEFAFLIPLFTMLLYRNKLLVCKMNNSLMLFKQNLYCDPSRNAVCVKKRLPLYLKVIIWPLAQKQARQTLLLSATISPRSTKDVSVMFCLYAQFWVGSEITLACFSEHITAYWFSLISWEEEGDTETGRRFFCFSFSSFSSGTLSSFQGSDAGGIKQPVASRNAILKIAPFNLNIVPRT